MGTAEAVKFVIQVVDASTAVITTLRQHIRQFVRQVQGDFRALKRVVSTALLPLRPVINMLQQGWHMFTATLTWGATMAATALTAGLIGGLIKTTVAFEGLRAQVQTLFGKDWKQAWDWADRFARKTTFTLDEVIQQMAQIKAYGLDPFQWLPVLADVAAAMGGGVERINRIALALGQIQQATRVTSNEMRQLTEAAIPAWETLAKRLGISTARLRDLVERGLVPASVALPALKEAIALIGTGGQARAMNTIAGAWSNLGDAWKRFLWGVGSEFSSTIQGIIRGFENLVEQLGKSGFGKTVSQWLKDAFSPENIRKVATFFGRIYQWGKQILPWLGKTVKTTVDYIANLFNSLVSVIGGEDGLWGAIKRVGMAILKFEAARAIFALVSAGATVITTIATISKNAAVIGTTVGAVLALFTAAIIKGKSWITAVEDAMAQAEGVGLGDVFNQLKQFPELQPFETPLPSELQGIVDTLIGGMTPVSKALSEIKSPAQETAQNTAGILDSMQTQERIISEIYGGGPRAKQLSARFGFGGVGIPANGVAVIELRGGDDYVRGIAQNVLSQAFQQMRLPHVVRVAG